MARMRGTRLWSAAVACLTAAPAAAQGWAEYAFPAAGVGLQLPAVPTAAQAPGDANQSVVSLQQGALSVALTITDFSGRGGDQGKALRAALLSARGAGAVTLDLDECVSGQPGRELCVDAPDGSRTKVSVFAVGAKLYVLQAKVSPPDVNELSGDAARIQQSMRFAGGPVGPGPGLQAACRGRAREASAVAP